MKYRLLIFLFAVSQVWGADTYPPAMRAIIDKCTTTAESFLQQECMIEMLQGTRHYRVTIADERDRDMQIAVFTVARAMRNRELSWAAWARQAVYGADWQVNPAIGVIPRHLRGEGLELVERVPGSYYPAVLTPYFGRVVDEFCSGWSKQCQSARLTKFVKEETDLFEARYGVSSCAGECHFLSKVMVSNGLKDKATIISFPPSDKIELLVDNAHVAALQAVLGLKFENA